MIEISQQCVLGSKRSMQTIRGKCKMETQKNEFIDIIF